MHPCMAGQPGDRGIRCGGGEGIMSRLLTPFIVLIERRRLRLVLSAALTATVVALVGLHARQAAAESGPPDVHRKMARDLRDEVNASRTTRARWARDVR